MPVLLPEKAISCLSQAKDTKIIRKYRAYVIIFPTVKLSENILEKKMKKYIVLLGLLAVLATPLFAQERFEDIMVRLDKAAAKAYLEQVQKAEKYRLDGIHPSLHQDIIDRIRQIHPSVSLVANLGKIHELYARSVETPSETFISYYVLVVTPDEEFTDRYYFYQVKKRIILMEKTI